MNEPDFYAVLGVDPDADPQTIRAAYRRAAREHHPDRGGSAQKFHQVQSAWDVLGSPDARAAYDRRRRTPGSARSADSPASTEEGAGFTYTRSAAQKSSAQHAAETRTRRRGETRSASADQPPVYEPPLATPEPLNLTLTSQKIHGGFVSRGLFSGRGRHRRLRTAALLEKHVLSALPAARLFNDVALTAAGTGRRGRDRTPKSAVRVDHVLLCGPTVILVSSHEVPAGAASWDGHALRAAGKSITLPDLAAQAKQLRISLAEQLREEHGVTGSLETDWQHILLAADDDPFHPVVQAPGGGAPRSSAAGGRPRHRPSGQCVGILREGQPGGQTPDGRTAQPSGRPGGRMSGVGLHVVLDQPEIPGNTGNAIRLAAITGFQLHIAGPTLFDFSDAKLRRAGLDYHDLAVLTEHQDLEAAYAALDITAAAEPNSAAPRVFAFSGDGGICHTEIAYRAGDVLLFGRESTGLDDHVKADPRVTSLVRIPMLPGRRSLNLANSVSIAVYEAWRQHGFPNAV